MKSVCLAVLLGSSLFAQTGGDATSSASTTAASQQTAAAPERSDDLARMRLDLDHMDGLLGNMSSEIEFLRDQNLQILLRTNAQMWTMLIRDLRQQLAREEQYRRGTPPESPKASPQSKPH